MLVYLPVNHLM